MNAATESDVSLLDPYRAEWTSLRAHRHNLLIEGPLTATHAALLLLKPHIGAPIEWKRPQGRFKLPSREGGALILEDVETLTAEIRRSCSHVLTARSPTRKSSQRPSTRCLRSSPAGLFDPALYYRLNVVLLRFNERDRHARTQRGQPHRSAPISTPPPLSIARRRSVTRYHASPLMARNASLFATRALSAAARPSSCSFFCLAISRWGASCSSSRRAWTAAFCASASSAGSVTISRNAARYSWAQGTARPRVRHLSIGLSGDRIRWRPPRQIGGLLGLLGPV